MTFACQLPNLLRLGVTGSRLRWLVMQGLAQHYLETTAPTQPQRTFERADNLRFVERSCFIISDAGTAVVEPFAVENRLLIDPKNATDLTPEFTGRTLFFGGVIVKRFKGPAGNQEIILLAFQEENWPYHLADPLPGKSGIVPMHRLNATITKLNAHQIHPLLRFRGDGTGTGITWERR